MFFQVLFRVLISPDLWQATLVFATLLVLPALGGVISERSGVVNIAMEGMMLTGAYASVMVALTTHSVWGGVIGAMIAGGLMALIHAVVSINFKANQIVSGIAINIFALGLTNYLFLFRQEDREYHLWRVRYVFPQSPGDLSRTFHFLARFCFSRISCFMLLC